MDGPGLNRTIRVQTHHPILAPQDDDWTVERGAVDQADDRTLFDDWKPAAIRADLVRALLFNSDDPSVSISLKIQDSSVSKPDEFSQRDAKLNAWSGCR